VEEDYLVRDNHPLFHFYFPPAVSYELWIRILIMDTMEDHLRTRQRS
jgi:hypothetical protein